MEVRSRSGLKEHDSADAVSQVSPTLPVSRENQQVVAPKSTLHDWHEAVRCGWVGFGSGGGFRDSNQVK